VKGWLLKFGGPVLVLFYLVLQLAALPQAALTDDDDFYIPAGISYAEWLGKVVRFDGAFQRESIDRAFEPNHEHPPLAKYVFGLCHFAFRGWLGPTDSARVGTVLFSTLLAAAMIWLARRHLGAERGLYAGGLAVLLLLLLPRFFFHSHAATLDVPVATMYFLAAAAVLEAERRPRAGWVAGVLFGLASATKLNGPFLLLPYGLFLMLTRWGLGRGEPRDPRTFNLPRIPTTLVTMATVGPLVFLGLWPWLWFDLFQRVGAYVGFHLHHYGILFLYFGTVYSKDPHAPWHAPFTMAATTTPLAITALALVGLGFGAAVVARRLRHREGPDDDQRKEGDLILSSALHAAFAILIVAFSGGAKYGGEKLFAPFFPVLVPARRLRRLEVVRGGRDPPSPGPRRWGGHLGGGLGLGAPTPLRALRLVGLQRLGLGPARRHRLGLRAPILRSRLSGSGRVAFGQRAPQHQGPLPPQQLGVRAHLQLVQKGRRAPP
jgi:4-amino-4-deoxy-L-arabinose transferase-like glycosyltransferase